MDNLDIGIVVLCHIRTYDDVAYYLYECTNDDNLGKECGEERPYVCDRCSKTYKYQSGLYIHQKYECNVEPQFACSYCSYRARQKGKAQKFTCPDCLRIYKHKARMESHRKYECVSQPSIQCPYCPYKVKQRSVMGRAMEEISLSRLSKNLQTQRSYAST
uniref:C2H2-type domain-containing protein n=1 Tax=Rhodnius prolixus TaxID=13249 RepID=T1HQ28_RHOPR